MQADVDTPSLRRWETPPPLNTRKKNRFSILKKWQTKRISQLDLADCFQQLAVLLQAGIPLNNALSMLIQESTHPTLSDVIKTIKQKIESGESFHQACKYFPQHFTPEILHLISLGENTGTLDKTLLKIAEKIEKQIALKNKVFNALFYPVCVLICALLVTIGLFIFVVPRFENLYSNFNASLPPFTRIIIHTADFIGKYLWLMGVLFATIFFTFKFLLRKYTFLRKYLHNIFLKLFFIGDLCRWHNISKIIYAISVYYNAGMPIAKAIQQTAAATNNLCYQDALLTASKQVSSGHSLATVFQTPHLFPQRISQMMRVAEDSGSLGTLLPKIADYYYQKFERALSYLNKILEPLLMILISLLIGGIMIAMYLPLFKIGTII